jgi:hypothetical protein
MKKLALGACLASLVGVIGCYSSTVVDGHKVWANRWQQDAVALRARAAFDLSCSAQDITLQVITVELPPSAFNNATVGNAKTVGAAGCGRRATYLRLDSDWVMNGASRTSAEGAPSRETN